MAETTETLTSSSGDAIHDMETGAGQFIRDSFGCIGGVILWGIVLLVIAYILYTRFCTKKTSLFSANAFPSSSQTANATCTTCTLPLPSEDEISPHSSNQIGHPNSTEMNSCLSTPNSFASSFPHFFLLHYFILYHLVFFVLLPSKTCLVLMHHTVKT